MALKEIGNYHWLETSENIGDEIFDLDIKNFTSDKAASTDFQSCNNTKIIISAGDKGIYPAAWATQEYKTEGTNAGDWCLPAAGIMSSIKNNMIAINNSLVLVEGTQINTSSMYWSSSENSSSYAWTSGFSDNYGLSYYAYGFKTSNHIVRPVLEF